MAKSRLTETVRRFWGGAQWGRMSITTLDGAIAGARPPFDIVKVGGTMEAAGVLHSLFYANGSPGAAAAPGEPLAENSG